MWTEIANLAISNGIFAALFVALLLYTLKDSSAREKKYTQTIQKLSTQLDAVQDIQKSIEQIDNSLRQHVSMQALKNKKTKVKNAVV